MYLRIHEHERSTIAALCDRELIGRIYREGPFVLDLKTYADFYRGSLVEEKEAVEALRSADSLNIVGRRSVALAKRLGLVADGDVRFVKSVPYVQVYRI
mgnify:CR=1 FL=1